MPILDNFVDTDSTILNIEEATVETSTVIKPNTASSNIINSGSSSIEIEQSKEDKEA